MEKSYIFNSVSLDCSDGVLEAMFWNPNISVVNFSNYPITNLKYTIFYFNGFINEVKLPKTLKRIESDFSGCSNLEKINIPDSVEYIDSSIFDYTPIYDDESNWENDILYKDNWAVDIRNLANINEIIIRDGTKGVCRNLAYDGYADHCIATSFKLPESLEIINETAFRDHNFKTIQLPKNLRILGKQAFYNCTNCEKIIINHDIEKVEDSPFFKCGSENTSTTSQIFIGKNVTVIPETMFSYTNLKSIIFEEGTQLKEIKDESFYSAGITSITLPNTITSIGRSAFEFSDLTEINFLGTVSEWAKVVKGYSWKFGLNIKYVQCLDGQAAI